MTPQRPRERDAAARVVYAPPDAWARDEVRIAGDEAHHLLRVLRARRGDRFDAVDGEGGRAVVEVTEAARREARCAIVERTPCEGALGPRVRLVPALIRAQRMDWIVEKAAELGAAAIAPIATSRGVAAPVAGRSGSHVARWERLAVAAMKQSRRAIRARIEQPVVLDEFLSRRDRSARMLVPWEGERGRRLGDTLAEAPPAGGEPIDLVVGPEGGFAPGETDTLRAAGGVIVSLGPAILRSETAALAALVVVLHRGEVL